MGAMTTDAPATDTQTAPTLLELIGDGDVFIHVRLEFPRYMRARHDEKFADHVDIVRFMGGSFDGAVSEGRSRFEVNLFGPRDPDQRDRDRPLFASLEFHHVALHYSKTVERSPAWYARDRKPWP